MMWDDIIIKYPELIPELPKDMIAMIWGYEADHPFDVHVAVGGQKDARRAEHTFERAVLLLSVSMTARLAVRIQLPRPRRMR